MNPLNLDHSSLEMFVEFLLEYEMIVLPILAILVLQFAAFTLLQVRRAWRFFKSKRRFIKQLKKAASHGA